MKYLTIENGKGYYSLDGLADSRKQIDEITKEELLLLVEFCVERKDFEMDQYDATLVNQPAHQIIYKNIYQKLNDLMNRRVSFHDEKNSLYRIAISKYSSELEE